MRGCEAVEEFGHAKRLSLNFGVCCRGWEGGRGGRDRQGVERAMTLT